MRLKTFRAVMARTKHGPKLREALRLVLVRNWPQSAAARRVGVSRQAVHRALLGIYGNRPDLVPRPATVPVQPP